MVTYFQAKDNTMTAVRGSHVNSITCIVNTSLRQLPRSDTCNTKRILPSMRCHTCECVHVCMCARVCVCVWLHVCTRVCGVVLVTPTLGGRGWLPFQTPTPPLTIMGGPAHLSRTPTISQPTREQITYPKPFTLIIVPNLSMQCVYPHHAWRGLPTQTYTCTQTYCMYMHARTHKHRTLSCTHIRAYIINADAASFSEMFGCP